MASKKNVIIFSILFIHTISLLSADFEGRIVVAKQTPYDTTLYEYAAKGNYVRLDIKNSDAQIIQSLIFDLELEKIIALSPNHKLYTTLKKHKNEYDKANDELIKTPNFKLIEGYKCYLWHVRNKIQRSDITFWITKQGFDFFPKVIRLLSYTEDYTDLSNYYMQIGLDNTFFPLLIIDRTLLKEEKSKMVVIHISNEPINANIFEIPKDYQLLRY